MRRRKIWPPQNEQFGKSLDGRHRVKMNDYEAQLVGMWARTFNHHLNSSSQPLIIIIIIFVLMIMSHDMHRKKKLSHTVCGATLSHTGRLVSLFRCSDFQCGVSSCEPSASVLAQMLMVLFRVAVMLPHVHAV